MKNCSIERQIEAELDARALVDLGGGAIADRGQHRIDRHDAADEEGHEQQAEEGQRDDEDDAGDPLRDAICPHLGKPAHGNEVQHARRRPPERAARTFVIIPASPLRR